METRQSTGNTEEQAIALNAGDQICPPKKKGLLAKLFGGNSSQPKINAKVQNIYDGVKTEYREKLFYGDVFSADNILSSLTRYVFGAANDANVDLCFQIYMQTWIRSHGGLDPMFTTPTYIKQALCERFSAIDANIVLKCVTQSLCEIYRREPELKKRADVFEAMQKNFHDNTQKNAAIEAAWLDDPEYGLVPEKPIFVNGFGKDKEYLSHLHSEDGIKLNFERVGSSAVRGIAGPVDLYRLLLPDGAEYLRIFVCNYGSRNYQAAPKGTKYIT